MGKILAHVRRIGFDTPARFVCPICECRSLTTRTGSIDQEHKWNEYACGHRVGYSVGAWLAGDAI